MSIGGKGSFRTSEWNAVRMWDQRLAAISSSTRDEHTGQRIGVLPESPLIGIL
jgi:hypothetical protein